MYIYIYEQNCTVTDAAVTLFLGRKVYGRGWYWVLPGPPKVPKILAQYPETNWAVLSRPWEDPKSRTPNSGFKYSNCVGYRALRWIYYSRSQNKHYCYGPILGTVALIPEVDLLFGSSQGIGLATVLRWPSSVMVCIQRMHALALQVYQ